MRSYSELAEKTANDADSTFAHRDDEDEFEAQGLLHSLAKLSQLCDNACQIILDSRDEVGEALALSSAIRESLDRTLIPASDYSLIWLLLMGMASAIACTEPMRLEIAKIDAERISNGY